MSGRLLFVILIYSFHKIQAQALLPPKLTVNPQMITETDSVTLNCQTPSSVSAYQCFFYTVRQGASKGFSCLQTLTGAELLLMAHQSSPAEVEVKCFYTVEVLQLNSPSPHSDTSSITIHSKKPQMSLHHIYGEHVLFICSLPGSAHHDTKCNLYFGEASRPVVTTTIWSKTTKNKQRICRFTVTIDDLLNHLHFAQQSDASCDYSLRSEPNSLSPRSDGYSLADIVEEESSMLPTKSAFIMTTDLTVSRPGASTFVTTVKPASGIVETESHMTQTKPTFTMTTAETWMWTFVAVAAGCGVTVGFILLASAILCNKRRTAGSEEVKRQESQNKNSVIYHLYSTISEEPAASALEGMVYSTVLYCIQREKAE